MKVTLIMGVIGCSIDLYVMKTDYVHDHQTAFLVDIPETKNKATRQFSITSSFYGIVKNYISLQPSKVTTNSIFLNFLWQMHRSNNCN